MKAVNLLPPQRLSNDQCHLVANCLTRLAQYDKRLFLVGHHEVVNLCEIFSPANIDTTSDVGEGSMCFPLHLKGRQLCASWEVLINTPLQILHDKQKHIIALTQDWYNSHLWSPRQVTHSPSVGLLFPNTR